MARQRMIKPEFWTSDQVTACSIPARLLFIGLWNFSDDAGRHKANVRRLKAEVFPNDDMRDDTVKGYVDQLVSVGLVLEYEVEGARYWQITGWHHQVINKPYPSTIPQPDLTVALPECSRSVPSEKKRREEKRSERKETPLPPLPDELASVSVAWAEWLEFRRLKGKPVSEKGALKSFQQFAKWGEKGAIASIEASIANDWQGLFEPKEIRNGRPREHADIERFGAPGSGVF